MAISKHSAHHQNLIPGGGQVWHNAERNAWYIAYEVPTRPGVFMLYWIEDAERLRELLPPGQALHPGTADRTFNNAQEKQWGLLHMGHSRGLSREVGAHPFTRLIADFEKNARLQPWLRDPEVLAAVADAALEGREFTAADLQGTNYWRTKTEAERNWIALVHQDPTTAARRVQDAHTITRDALVQAGIANPPEELVTVMSANLTTGRWTEDYWKTQIKYLADPFARPRPDALDYQIQEILGRTGAVDTTQKGVDKVREAVNRYLGPAFAGGWKEENVQYWAGQVRNDPDAEQRLRDMLKSQFQALFPAYKDNPDADYETVAAPWRAFVSNVWGQDPDEADPLFLKLVAMNDSQAAGELLRKEGLSRGVGKVVTDATEALGQQFGFGVIPTGR